MSGDVEDRPWANAVAAHWDCPLRTAPHRQCHRARGGFCSSRTVGPFQVKSCASVCNRAALLRPAVSAASPDWPAIPGSCLHGCSAGTLEYAAGELGPYILKYQATRPPGARAVLFKFTCILGVGIPPSRSRRLPSLSGTGTSMPPNWWRRWQSRAPNKKLQAGAKVQSVRSCRAT